MARPEDTTRQAATRCARIVRYWDPDVIMFCERL